MYGPKPWPNPVHDRRSRRALDFSPLSVIIPAQNWFSIPWNSDLGDKYHFFISHFLEEFHKILLASCTSSHSSLQQKNELIYVCKTHLPIFLLKFRGGVLFTFLIRKKKKRTQGITSPQEIIFYFMYLVEYLLLAVTFIPTP